jgi:hypothetical protein
MLTYVLWLYVLPVHTTCTLHANTLHAHWQCGYCARLVAITARCSRYAIARNLHPVEIPTWPPCCHGITVLLLLLSSWVWVEWVALRLPEWQAVEGWSGWFATAYRVWALWGAETCVETCSQHARNMLATCSRIPTIQRPPTFPWDGRISERLVAGPSG